MCPPSLTSGGRGWRGAHGVCSAQGSAGLTSGLLEPQLGMAGWPEGWGAEGFPKSSSGGHEKRRSDTYPGSLQTDFFLLLKISIPRWGCSCDRGLFIFMLSTSWFPVPLAL